MDWRNDHPKIASSGDPSHMQSPNPSTIAEAKVGTSYGCLLRGSARAILIQMRMLTSNHQTEDRDPNEGGREITEGAERVYNPIGKTKLLTNKTYYKLPGTETLTNEFTQTDP